MIISLLKNLGIYPAHAFSLYFPLGVLILWLLFLPFAYIGKMRIFYNSSLKAAFGEELLFRGLIYGGSIYLWHNQLAALLLSSLLFGLAHM